MGYAGAEKKNHLRFDILPLEPGKKMHKYEVINTTFHQKIGIMHFRGGWRQYVFRADPEVDMTKSCHKEIDDFRDKLMVEWRKRLKKEKSHSSQSRRK